MDVQLRLILLAAVVALATGAAVWLRRYVGNAEIPTRFDRRDVDVREAGPLLVEFTSPYCHECQRARPLLEAASAEHDASLAVIDARERPDLASKYSIRTTPTILVVDPSGKVTSGWLAKPPKHDLNTALQSAASA